MRRELARVPGALALARLTVETIRVCLRYRVTGLASEAGFFMLLSLPPLLLGLFGGVGYLGQWLGERCIVHPARGGPHSKASMTTGAPGSVSAGIMSKRRRV